MSKTSQAQDHIQSTKLASPNSPPLELVGIRAYQASKLRFFGEMLESFRLGRALKEIGDFGVSILPGMLCKQQVLRIREGLAVHGSRQILHCLLVHLLLIFRINELHCQERHRNYQCGENKFNLHLLLQERIAGCEAKFDDDYVY
jgi:hypothetical protein